MWHFFIDTLYMIVDEVRRWAVRVAALVLILIIVFIVLEQTGYDIRELFPKE